MSHPDLLRDPKRLATLDRLGLLDTPAVAALDRLTQLATKILGVPVALVSLVGADRQFFASSVGLAEPWASARQTPLSHSFCQHVVASGQPLVVVDAREHPLVRDNPAIAELSVVAYAGMPLITSDDQALGTLCAIDSQPRNWTTTELEILRNLAASALSELELRLLTGRLQQQAEQIAYERDEREQTLQQLSLAEVRYRTLVEQIPAVTFIAAADESGDSLYVSPQITDLLGFTPEEWQADPGMWLQRIHPEDRERILTTSVPAFADGQPAIGDFRVLDRDGQVRWVDSRVVLVRDEHGRPRWVQGVWLDITERKRAEEQLHSTLAALQTQYAVTEHARSQTRAVLDAATDGMAVVAPDYRFLAINRRFTELFGFGPDQVVGRSFHDLQWEVEQVYADPAAFRAAVAKTVQDPERQVTSHLVQRWPEPRELELVSRPVHAEQGTHLGRLYVFRDVTRERELARLKDELVGIVSHDLRTPLASIIGFVELLLARPFTEEQRREFLHVVLGEGQRLTALIDDFLDVQRLESGRQLLTPRPSDVRTLLEQAVTAAGPDPRHSVVIDAAHDLPPVLADPARLQQILLNLLSNARKYSPDGGTVRISAVARDGFIEIGVRDQGLGIPASALPQLFEKFYRVDAADREGIKGTGLGLAICRQLVEAHGGTIWAESTGPGQGSRFCFTLPLAGTRSHSS
ncbi:MAG: PAS domain S-box protein [Chloroflexi bacterium]|nr:PAS domain S-box protein [Chloroflexota bacterium]